MWVRGIRGATTVESNAEEEILAATAELLGEMVMRNDVGPWELAAGFFTVSPDLNAVFPARAAREMGWQHVPLMCAGEIAVPDGLKRCIRVLLLANTALEQERIQHVYLRQAAVLRPDLQMPFAGQEGGL